MDTRARYVTLDQTTTTCLRALHRTCGGVTLQRFALGGSVQVELTADQLAALLRTLPLAVVRDASLELEARAIANATVLAEVERMEREDNPFFDLDVTDAPGFADEADEELRAMVEARRGLHGGTNGHREA